MLHVQIYIIARNETTEKTIMKCSWMQNTVCSHKSL